MYGVWPCFIKPIWGRRQEIAPKWSRREWEGAKAPLSRRKASASEILQAPAGYSSSLLTLSWVAIFPLFVLFVFSDIWFPYRYCSERTRGTRAKEPTAKIARERTDCEERVRKNRLRESARVTSSVRRSTSVAASLTESLLLRQVGVHSDLIFFIIIVIYFIFIIYLFIYFHYLLLSFLFLIWSCLIYFYSGYNLPLLQGRQRHRGTSRLTSRQKATTDAHNPSETIPKGPTTIPAEASKGLAEGSLMKRSARTRERLQPIGADASHTVHHDSNNNITKPAETGTETKGAVAPLTKRITTEVVKEKPGTANKANDIEEDRTEEVSVVEGGQFLPPIKWENGFKSLQREGICLRF